MKYCKDCKWFEKSSTGLSHFAKCICPKVLEKDLVDGEIQSTFCSIQRSVNTNVFHFENYCSEEGKLFEPKEEIR